MPGVADVILFLAGWAGMRKPRDDHVCVTSTRSQAAAAVRIVGGSGGVRFPGNVGGGAGAGGHGPALVATGVLPVRLRA